jgi:hypothetical protein
VVLFSSLDDGNKEIKNWPRESPQLFGKRKLNIQGGKEEDKQTTMTFGAL